MTRVVTFPSRDLYGYGNIQDCLLIETFREGSIGASILLTIISCRIFWFRRRFKPKQLVALSFIFGCT